MINYEKKAEVAMVNNFITSNKTNNHPSPQIKNKIEYIKTP